jgi:hypothetical protein
MKEEKPSLIRNLLSLKSKNEKLILTTGIIRNPRLKNDFIKRTENIERLTCEENKLKNEFRIKKCLLKGRTIKLSGV